MSSPSCVVALHILMNSGKFGRTCFVDTTVVHVHVQLQE